MSLIDKAKSIQTGGKHERRVDSEMIALTIAYLQKEITGKQYTQTIDVALGSANHIATSVLRRGLDLGLVKVELL